MHSGPPFLEECFRGCSCSCCRISLPIFILVTVGVVAYGLDDQAGKEIPYASSFHLESYNVVLLSDVVSMLAGLHYSVARSYVADVYGWRIYIRRQFARQYVAVLESYASDNPADFAAEVFAAAFKGVCANAGRVFRRACVTLSNSMVAMQRC